MARLDPESAARLLGDPFRLYSYAQTVALRSAITRAGGDPAAARAQAERAVALGREACRMADPAPDDWVEWIVAAERDLAGGAGGAGGPGDADERT